MPAFKILKRNLGLTKYLKTNCLCSVTEHIKIDLCKFSIRKNNFLYKNEFGFVREENGIKQYIKKSDEETVATKSRGNEEISRSNQHLEKLKIKPRPSQKSSSSGRTLASLQYKGEILYGIHPVYLALLQRKRRIHQLFLRTSKDDTSESGNIQRKDEIEKMARAQGVEVSYVDSKGMKYLAPGVVHQGVCLDTSPLPLPEWLNTESLIESQDTSTCFPLWLVLDEILDPMNVGAIIRSAYYFGINELFVIRGNSCKLSPTVSKASSGALEVVNIHLIEKLKDFIEVKKTQGWNAISTISYCKDEITHLRPTVDVTELKISKPTILILGNEGKGISNEIQNLCDSFVSIPPIATLHQGIDSLNVSVAAGVIFYSLSKKMKAIS